MTDEQLALIQQGIDRYRGAAGAQPEAPPQAAPQAGPVDPVQLGQQAISRWNGGNLSTPDTTWSGNGPGDLEEAPPVSAPPAAMMGAPEQPEPEQAPPTGAPMPQDVQATAGAPPTPPQRSQAPAGPVSFDQSVREFDQSAKHEADAIRQGGEAKAQGFEQEAEVHRQQADETAKLHEQWAAERKQAAEDLKQTREKFEKTNAEAAKMQVVSQRTTSQKVAGILGLAFAGIADGMAMGFGHPAHNVEAVSKGIDQAVSNDLEQQRAALEDKRKSAASHLTELGLAQKTLDNVDDQYQYATNLTQLKYASSMKAQAAKIQSPQVRAAAEAAASGVETNAKKSIAELTEKHAAQQMRSGRGAAKGGGGIAAGQRVGTQAELEAKVAQGITLSDAEAGLLKQQQELSKRNDRNNAGGETKEIIPGYVQSDSTQPLEKGEIGEVRKGVRAATGVHWLSNKLAGLWDQAMDPKTNAADRASARSEYEGVKNDLLSGKSVQTGQGTITEGDAKRTGGALPDLPRNWLGSYREAENYVKGTDPGAKSIRALGSNAMEQLHQQLEDTYGIVPRARFDAERASRAGTPAAQAAGGAPPSPRQAAPQPAAKPVPAGMVRVLWPATGRTYTLPPAEASEMLRNGGQKL